MSAMPAYRLPELQHAMLMLEARAVEVAARDRFAPWLERAAPEYRWDARHFRLMQDVLDRVTSGELRRVAFSLPIRHGKSIHNTIHYSAYRLERDPRTRILLASYKEEQAQKFSRQIRRLVRGRGMQLDRDASGEWETSQGGGVRSVGAGSGVASVNADLIVVDDPIGSRDEAESAARRDRVWDWITNDLLARCELDTAVLLTASRWHQDDPLGRLLDRQAGAWYVVDLPGRAEPNDALGRAVDEPLWFEERGEEWLTEKRIELGEYGFASLVQGRPRPRAGGMFKWDWWKKLDVVPAVGGMVRYWDLAGTDVRSDGHDPDYSAGALLCRMVDGRTAIVDVERFRYSVAGRDARLREVCASDIATYPGRVVWWIETEAGIQGRERTAEIVRAIQNMGMPCYTEHPTGSKIARAEPLASKAEAGNVYLCPGAWRDPFRLEAADFPNGKHDDQIDAAAGADAKLAVANVVTAQTMYI